MGRMEPGSPRVTLALRPPRHADPPRSLAPWIGWSLWALMVAVQLLNVVLFTLDSEALQPTWKLETVTGFLPILAFGTVGALILSRRPGNVVGWLCCAVGLGQSLASFGGQGARAILAADPGRIPGGLVLYQLGSLAWELSWVALGLLLLLFPTAGFRRAAGGRPAGRPSPLSPALDSRPRSCRVRSLLGCRLTRLGSNRLRARCGWPTEPIGSC
jgi:hypothetical protein